MLPTPLYLDLDDTLIQNTNLLKRDLFALYESTGFDLDLVQGAYQAKVLPAHEFTPARFLDHLLTTSGPCDCQAIKSSFTPLYERFTAGFLSYLYPDTRTFLDSIDRSLYSVQLLSFGCTEFQEDKLRWSGLLPYFPQESRHIVSGLKDEYLAGLHTPEDHFIMVDDKPWILESILKRFPNAEGILAHPCHCEHIPEHPRLRMAASLSDISLKKDQKG